MSLKINGTETNKLTLIQKEGKTISITYNVDIATATFSLVAKDSDGSVVFTKENSDFDKAQVSVKKVLINFNTIDLDRAVGTYDVQIKATWDTVTSVDKTIIIKLKIEKSLFI